MAQWRQIGSMGWKIQAQATQFGKRMAGSDEQFLDPASGHNSGIDPTCERTGGANPTSSAWMGSAGQAHWASFFLFFLID